MKNADKLLNYCISKKININKIEEINAFNGEIQRVEYYFIANLFFYVPFILSMYFDHKFNEELFFFPFLISLMGFPLILNDLKEIYYLRKLKKLKKQKKENLFSFMLDNLKELDFNVLTNYAIENNLLDDFKLFLDKNNYFFKHNIAKEIKLKELDNMPIIDKFNLIFCKNYLNEIQLSDLDIYKFKCKLFENYSCSSKNKSCFEQYAEVCSQENFNINKEIIKFIENNNDDLFNKIKKNENYYKLKGMIVIEEDNNFNFNLDLLNTGILNSKIKNIINY